MPKIIEKFTIASAVEESNVRRARKDLAPIILDKMHTNQPHELAQHLKYDCSHRILPKFRANPRATHPSLIGASR